MCRELFWSIIQHTRSLWDKLLLLFSSNMIWMTEISSEDLLWGLTWILNQWKKTFFLVTNLSGWQKLPDLRGRLLLTKLFSSRVSSISGGETLEFSVITSNTSCSLAISEIVQLILSWRSWSDWPAGLWREMCNVYSLDVSRDFPRGEQTEKTLFIEPKVFSMIFFRTIFS